MYLRNHNGKTTLAAPSDRGCVGGLEMEPFAAESAAAVGGVMRQLRLARGLTLEELAKRVGCVKGYLSAIERGKRPPPQADLAAKLERELAAPPDLFVRAAAWCRTPQRIRAELKRDPGEESLWLCGVPGFEEARCAAVMAAGSDVVSLQRGDVAILGPVVERDSLREGWVVAVERPEGHADLIRWPCLVRGERAVFRRVLGVCRTI